MKIKIILFAVVISLSAACAGRKNVSTPLSLATFTEKYVTVSIHLDGNANGGYFISAAFTPPDGYHLYSKDIPLTGVDGLGRPTLLELTAESQMKPMGVLIENVRAEAPNFEPKELLVYPPGSVTLSLPVELPPRNGWVDDIVKVTYMACSDRGCKPPVTGKLVPVRIPGAVLIANQ